MRGPTSARSVCSTPVRSSADARSRLSSRAAAAAASSAAADRSTYTQGLTLIHFPAHWKRFLWDRWRI
jgi:hypothetical protein